MWALAWFAEQHRLRCQYRAELLRTLRGRFVFLFQLSNRHGLHGFNPHRSMHRLVLPPVLPPPSRDFRAALFGTALGPPPAPVVDPKLRVRRSKRRRGRFDLDGRRLKRGEHSGWCSHDTRRGCNCGAESEETEWRASSVKRRGRRK